jgi:hypothetical protein
MNIPLKSGRIIAYVAIRWKAKERSFHLDDIYLNILSARIHEGYQDRLLTDQGRM